MVYLRFGRPPITLLGHKLFVYKLQIFNSRCQWVLKSLEIEIIWYQYMFISGRDLLKSRFCSVELDITTILNTMS